MIARYVFALALGIVTTFVLFLLMQALIKSDKSPFEQGAQGRIVDFVRLQDDMDIRTKQRKPTPPPPPDEPPPDMPKPTFVSNVESMGVDIGAIDVGVNLNIGQLGGFSSDGDYLPIVKVAPVYPR